MTRKDQEAEFDFDEWVRLARENPEQFELLREQKIREMIADVPDEIRHRMEGLQWQIDQMRQTAKNPMASCIKISAMMWDTVLGDEGLVQSIENLGKPQPVSDTENRKKAKIIDFGKSHDTDNQA